MPASVLSSLDGLSADMRAIVAALEGEDDPTIRERLDRVLDRMTKIEEAIALLMDDDVEDVPLEPVVAGFVPFKKGGGKKDDGEDDGEDPDKADDATASPKPDTGDEALDTKPDTPPAAAPPKAPPAAEDNGEIETVTDLHNAIRKFGSAPDKASQKALIKRRAKELNAESDLPDSWE